jgi:hypothetical protein
MVSGSKAFLFFLFLFFSERKRVGPVIVLVLGDGTVLAKSVSVVIPSAAPSNLIDSRDGRENLVSEQAQSFTLRHCLPHFLKPVYLMLFWK